MCVCCYIYLSRPFRALKSRYGISEITEGWRSPFRHQNMFVDSYQFFRALTQLTFDAGNVLLLRENQNRTLRFLPRIQELVKSDKNFSVSRRWVRLMYGNIGTSLQRRFLQRRNRPIRSVLAQIKSKSCYAGIIDSYLAVRIDELSCV